MSRTKIDTDLINKMHAVIIDQTEQATDTETFLRSLFYAWKSNSNRSPMFFLIESYRAFKAFDGTVTINEVLDTISREFKKLNKDLHVFSDIDVICARGYLQTIK